MSNEWNIKDDEIRVIGSEVPPKDKRPGKAGGPIVWILAILAVILLAAIIVLLERRRTVEPDEPGLFESGDTLAVLKLKEVEVISPFGDYSDTTGLAYTETIQKTVNDIPLTIFIPHNAVPELCLKAPDYRNKDIILATQAADIRRDNKKIVGAFVLKGEPLAWGLSKKGYCGIIDGEITVGVADNGTVVCYLESSGDISVGDEVSVNGQKGEVSAVSSTPVSAHTLASQYDEYTFYSLNPSDWSYAVEIKCDDCDDGINSVKIIYDSVHPISFITG